MLTIEQQQAALDVYVPAAGTRLATEVLPGSAIVGSPWQGMADTVLIDYEGNRYHADNIRSYTDKLIHAAGRHLDRYPTVARRLVQTADLRKVGVYRHSGGAHRFDVTDQEALDGWAGTGWEA